MYIFISEVKEFQVREGYCDRKHQELVWIKKFVGNCVGINIKGQLNSKTFNRIRIVSYWTKVRH